MVRTWQRFSSLRLRQSRRRSTRSGSRRGRGLIRNRSRGQPPISELILSTLLKLRPLFSMLHLNSYFSNSLLQHACTFTVMCIVAAQVCRYTALQKTNVIIMYAHFILNQPTTWGVEAKDHEKPPNLGGGGNGEQQEWLPGDDQCHCQGKVC